MLACKFLDHNNAFNNSRLDQATPSPENRRLWYHLREGMQKMASKKNLIYEEILGRLFEGRYRFGAPIPVKEISEETGASRNPIMAALYRLQDNGFVRITAQAPPKSVVVSLSRPLTKSATSIGCLRRPKDSSGSWPRKEPRLTILQS